MWLAEEFRPEHRSVLEWLNESGPKDVKFFAIKPRVVSIEGSEKRGFEFEVVVEPNDWERELTMRSHSQRQKGATRNSSLTWLKCMLNGDRVGTN